jgi:hypothetical protein
VEVNPGPNPPGVSDPWPPGGNYEPGPEPWAEKHRKLNRNEERKKPLEPGPTPPGETDPWPPGGYEPEPWPSSTTLLLEGKKCPVEPDPIGEWQEPGPLAA